MLSGRTIATITVAAPTMYALEALIGGVYAQDGEKLAEVAREDPVAARTIEEGGSAPNDGRPSVLSPDEQLQVRLLVGKSRHGRCPGLSRRRWR